MGDLGKLIVAKGFKKLLKLQENAKSSHTAIVKPTLPEIILGGMFVAKINYRPS